MKRALCVDSFDDIAKLIHNEEDVINSSFVSRELCEDPANNYKQIIPYVTFYTINEFAGQIKFVQYVRPATNNEDRLAAKRSIGFGGHIDNLDDVSFESSYQAEDGTTHFVMSKDDLLKTIFATANREIIEELNVDFMTRFGLEFNPNDAAFFVGDQSQEVNQVHLGLSIPVKLTEEQMSDVLLLAQPKADEIESVSAMSVNLKLIVEEMDINTTMLKIVKSLKEEHQVEDWSCNAFNYIVRKELLTLLKDVNYDDLIKIAKQKKLTAQVSNEVQVPKSEKVTDVVTDAAEVVAEPTIH